MLNAREDNIDYLLKDKTMRRGFHYLCRNSDEFSIEAANLKKNVSLLADGILTEETLKTVKRFVDRRIDNYLKELRDANTYVAKIINRIKVTDAELILSELYFKSQIYFLYNEVFTYGSMDLILRHQITKRKSDVEKTLLELSNYKGTAVHTLYKMLAGFQIPNTKPEFIKLRKRDKKFNKAVDKLRMRISDYFEKEPTLDEIYDMIKASNEHVKSIHTETNYPHIKKTIVQLYAFIVDTQRKLFISQNIYMKAAKRIFKKFPKLNEMYGGRKSKGPLLNLYLNKVK